MQRNRNDHYLPLPGDIIEFLKPIAGTNKIYPDTDIYKGLGIAGDDFHEMIETFAAMYAVDMANYRWYFHADEEGVGCLGRFIFKPPYNRVKRIPVTPAMLAAFATKGKWDLVYPEHKIPDKRYDILIDQLLLVVISVLLITVFVKNVQGEWHSLLRCHLPPQWLIA